MSLINDALKRARVSALQQEAENSGSDYRAVPAHSRRGSWSWVQLAGWLVAAAAITLVLFLALRPSSSSVTGSAAVATPAGESPAPVPQSAPPAVVTEATEKQAGVDEISATAVRDPSTPESAAATAQAAASDPPPPRALPTEAPERGSAELPEASATGAGETPAVAAETPRQPPPVAPATPASSSQPQTASRLVDGKVYLRRARSADGSEVELGGIAFSEDRPIAVINGKVLSPGDMVAGFVVLRIEAERVWLEADSVRIYLALH